MLCQIDFLIKKICWFIQLHCLCRG